MIPFAVLPASLLHCVWLSGGSVLIRVQVAPPPLHGRLAHSVYISIPPSHCYAGIHTPPTTGSPVCTEILRLARNRPLWRTGLYIARSASSATSLRFACARWPSGTSRSLQVADPWPWPGYRRVYSSPPTTTTITTSHLPPLPSPSPSPLSPPPLSLPSLPPTTRRPHDAPPNAPRPAQRDLPQPLPRRVSLPLPPSPPSPLPLTRAASPPPNPRMSSKPTPSRTSSRSPHTVQKYPRA